jgi:hypothetical protein
MPETKETPTGVRFGKLKQLIKKRVAKLKKEGVKTDFSKFVRDAVEDKLNSDK